MHGSLISTLADLEVTASFFALVVMLVRRQARTYQSLTAFLAVRSTSGLLLILAAGPGRHLFTRAQAYDLYFYTFWSSYLVETLLGFGIIYGVYCLAMAPLKGLQGLGVVMFRWAFAIALAVSVSTGLGPHALGMPLLTTAIQQLMRTQSVLTLCLLLFVCLAARPLGLSYRSRVFGVSLGLGVLAVSDLMQVAWTPGMQSPSQFVLSASVCLAFVIWAVFFALPEPRRRMIVLPTTSPFLRWNQISLALGDSPGFVVVNEVHPEMFAPAELEIMRRASAKMEPVPAPKAVAFGG